MAGSKTLQWITLDSHIWPRWKLKYGRKKVDFDTVGMFTFLINVCKQLGTDGKIPGGMFEDDYSSISEESMMYDTERAKAAVEKLKAIGQLESIDGEWWIAEFECYQWNPSKDPNAANARKREQRTRDKVKELEAKIETFICDTSHPICDMSQPEKMSQMSQGPDLTGPDQTRPDQKNPPNPPPGGECDDAPRQEDPRPAEIHAYWCQQMERNPLQATLTSGRRSKIKSRLKRYSVEDIKLAIDGVRSSAHHMGANDRTMIYDDLEMICGSDTKLEKYRDWGERARAARVPPPQRIKPGMVQNQHRRPEQDSSVTPEEAIRRANEYLNS